MSNFKWQECRRCNAPFLESKEDAERRRFLDAALICICCEKELEQEIERRKLGKLYYVGNTEPFMC